MKRFSAALFGLLLTTAAHAQSGLLPANQVWAGPPSGGQGFARARALVAADIPLLSGDCTTNTSGVITCTKTNSTAFTVLATTTPGTGVVTALGVNVGSAGAFVVNGGVLGTPASGTLTNATGLPIGTGVSGLGTGVATALGVAVGSAGAPVVNGGVLGTPSSGVGTNLTALNASNLSSGTVAAARGGAGTITGALKGSGAGVVSQAACADVSDASVYCNAARGQMPGTATNDNASAGNVREYVVSDVLTASSISLTSSTVANVTSISLTAGDWDVWGVVGFTTTATTTVAFLDAGVTTTTGSMPTISTGGYNSFSQPSSTVPGNLADPEFTLNVAPVRLSLSGTTTVFLTARGVFGASTLKAYGSIRARRR